MPSDALVTVPGSGSAPLTYAIAPAQEVVLKAAFAQFNGAAAAGSFLPCLRILSPSGQVVGEYITDSAVGAGSSAEVSFAPFLRSGGAGGSTTPSGSVTVRNLQFVSVGTPISGAAAVTITVPIGAGVQWHDLLIDVFGFENVAPGSGPWINDVDPHFGWQRVMYQEPVGGNGAGLEIWAAYWEVGASTPWDFAAAQNVIAQNVIYRNAPASALVAISAHTAQAVSGNNPVAPSVTTTAAKSFVIPIAADTLASGSFGYPAGTTQRYDNARSGSVGNVEITLGDREQDAIAPSGSTTLTASVTGGTARGATATLAVQPLVDSTSAIVPLIGLTAYTPAADVAIAATNSTSPFLADALNAVVTFAGPASGHVLVRLSCFVGINNNSNTVYFCVMDGPTLKAEAAVFETPSGVSTSQRIRETATLRVTGLTYGATFAYSFAFRVSGAASTATLYGGPTYGPLTIEVWAAP